MRLEVRTCALLAALMALPFAALAQDAAPAACAANSDGALPTALQGWNGKRTGLAAAATQSAAASALLPIGRSVNGQLRKSPDVTLPVGTTRPPAATSYSGLYELRITEAGDYQVSLGSNPWIEMVADGAALPLAANAPGPNCATLRKTVAYSLRPGRYVLEIVGNANPVLPLMVTRVK